jgi:hypothetical protein
VVKQGGFDPALAAELRRLFELRSIADYMWLDEAEPGDYDPLDAAQRFVEGVKGWLAPLLTAPYDRCSEWHAAECLR